MATIINTTRTTKETRINPLASTFVDQYDVEPTIVREVYFDRRYNCFTFVLRYGSDLQSGRITFTHEQMLEALIYHSLCGTSRLTFLPTDHIAIRVREATYVSPRQGGVIGKVQHYIMQIDPSARYELEDAFQIANLQTYLEEDLFSRND
jgi:hypothetical protein